MMLCNQDSCELLLLGVLCAGMKQWRARCCAAVCRSMNTLSLQDMPIDLATYVSQMKYYERMHKVKEREQHIQEVRCCAMLPQHNAVSGLCQCLRDQAMVLHLWGR